MRRPFVQQRQRVFVGCEGESERGYVALIQRLLGRTPAHHLVAHVLNGGDPLAIVESAAKAMRQEQQRDRGMFVAKFIFLDEDVKGVAPPRDQQAIRLAEENGYRLIWQRPCHEALLLRHLDQRLRPMTTAHANQAILRSWPEYRKNMAAAQLALRIDLAAVNRAAEVEDELREFLVLLGLVETQ